MSTDKKSKKAVITQQQIEPLSPQQMKEVGYDFTNHSEIIAKYIIEKIISNALTSHQRNVIDRKIPSHCFDFYHRIFNDMLQSEFLTYDRDDVDIDKSIPTRQTFFDNRYSGYNDWSSLTEPKSSKIDRGASTYIRVVKTLLPVNEETDKPGQVPTGGNNVMTGGSHDTTGSKKKPEEKTSSLSVIPQGKGGKQVVNLVALCPQYALEIKEPIEDDFILNAREDKKKALEKSAADIRQQEFNKKQNIEKTNELSKKNKEFERKNVTTDASGNPLVVKGVVIDKLADLFLFAKTFNNDKNEIINLKNEKTQNSDREKTKTNYEKDEKKELKEKPKPINPNLTLPKTKNPEVEVKTHTVIPDKPSVIQPAGSNFDMMVAECGVTIIEGGKQKSGGKDFFLKFGKHSLANYKTLFNNSQQSNYNSSTLNMDQTQEAFEKLRDTGKNLPMINTKKTTFDVTKSMNQTMQSNSIKFNSKYGSIKTALDSLELIPEFEERDNNDKIYHNDLFKERRRSLQIHNNSNIEQALEEMNRFNSMIMKNSQWGTTAPVKGNRQKGAILPNKPNTKEIERELGKNIVNTKLPRARQLSKVHAAIFVKKDQSLTLADQTIYSHLVIEEGGSLILKNVNVMGDIDNKGDVKTQGNVVFNGKIKTVNKITALKKLI